MHIAFTLLLAILVNPTIFNAYSCSEYYDKHPVRNAIGLQVLLKNNGYYTGKVDGQIGSKSISAIKKFQKNAGLADDGVVGKDTCIYLININEYQPSVDDNTLQVSIDNDLKDVQSKLQNLGLYTGEIDGIRGSRTTNAIKTFQQKAGLIVDGVIGPKTLAELEKGEESYVETINEETLNSNAPNTSTNIGASSSALDLTNYNPNLPCTNGYVNNIGVWVPDPCFYPVFVYRFGKVAQVNSAAERDAYLADRWSLTAERIYTPIGPVNTQNYTDGIHSPVNGLVMPFGKSYPNVVLGIKNDNNLRARPQSGPQDADAVFEVLVEGGMTRFINIYYQSDTTYHGPIRSARPTDPTVLRPVNGVLIASGATSGLIPEILDIGVPVISDQRNGYFRISSHPTGSSRKAPHNLYADTNLLRQRAIKSGYKPNTHPQPLFPWGDPDISKWKDISKMTLTFSNYTKTTWTWNGTTYLRTYYDAYMGSSNSHIHNTVSSSGSIAQINTDTIIALFCEPYIHPLQLPSVKTVGQGRAIIMHGGKLLDAFWKRGDNSDPFHIVDGNGNELLLPRGKVWISLVPNTKSPSFG